MVYDYDRHRPFRVRGHWSIEGDTWCRGLIVRGAERYKCQTLVDEGDAFYLMDLDGKKSSRIFKTDISK